ncbi:MAG: helicase-exonuclease AddAB subunit AddA [Lachnospiraceae bacterium]|nr:helicase-exonuclease AddAB subunit AddA [Lachnospiraceae bacterium]
MSYTFSNDQQQIIDSRHQNILVSAAAGSGKTSVLTERIVGLVSDPVNPVDIDRILVVTFTNAAAKEMKERIGKRLNEMLAAHPDNEHLQKQATLIHSAQITTIDSFCLYLLKNHFTKVDADPSFRVAGEGEIELLKEDVLKDVIKRAYASKDENFYHTVDCYAKKDKDDSLEKSIMKLYDYAMSYPYPIKWLEKRRTDYEFESFEAFKESDLCKSITEDIVESLDDILAQVESTRRNCLIPGGAYGYEPSIEGDYNDIKDLKESIKGKSYDEVGAALAGFGFATLKGKSDCEEEEKKYIQNLRKAYKEALAGLHDKFFYQSLEDFYADMRDTAPVVSKVIDLVEDFHESFAKAKRDRLIIDFSDMEHFAVKLLVDDYHDDGTYEISDVARDYREYYKEVMVDEYQDSNLVQELIVQSVSGENVDGIHNRFMVGDVKQSIYRFRLARPEIFVGKTQQYVKDEKSSHRLITLKENYRSRSAVIDSVNAVFEKVMTEDCGKVEYNADARLYKGGDYPDDTEDNITELILVKSEEKVEKARKTEAAAIAQKIEEIRAGLKVKDKKSGALRDTKYSDIAVLFRSPSKWGNTLKDAFESAGIPYHIEGTGDFYDTTEIRQVISFLKIVNNPLDDISLYGAMTSFFGGMDDEECARVKALGGNGGRFFYNKLVAYVEGYPDDKKASDFLALLKRYRDLSKILPINELISKLFDETGYKHVVSAIPDGEKRLANVNMLVLKAAEYAKTSFYGLFHFLRYVELIKKLEKDEGEANTFDENSNVVKVMSIHKSKGLEFPVCIVAGIDENFNESDQRAEFVTDIDAGIGASYIDPVNRVKRPTLKKLNIIAASTKEMVGEEIRILYVGLTRAKEKLVMVGLSKDPDDWKRHVGSGKIRSYLDAVKPAVTGEAHALFKFESVDEADITLKKAAGELKQMASRELLDSSSDVDETLYAKLKERLSFVYPHKALERLYTKTTVSNLKMAAIEREDDGSFKPFEENESSEYIPLFAGGSHEVKGTDRGTAYHEVMQLTDFVKVIDSADRDTAISEEFGRIVSLGRMSAEDVAKVRKDRIKTFFESTLGREMAEAERNGMLYKEQPFVIGVPASSVEEGFSEDETILVQGVIDAFFVCDGKVSVVDYKTDRVDSADELIKRYKKQLEYYGEAVKKLTGMPVDRLLIYSFALGGVFVVK